MRTLEIALAAMLASAAFGPAASLAASPKQQAQQQRMKDCNAKADTQAVKGPDRQAFMKTCLSGHDTATAAAKPTQQDKMKWCNAEAGSKGLKGDQRKTFMSSCLSGSAAN